MTTEIITQTITTGNECGECDNKCGVCGQRLAYVTVTRTKTCALCHKEETSVIGCPNDHYVCRECDSKKALEIIDRILSTTQETSPVNIIELVMANPEVSMYGAVHYELVPAAILTAVGNTGYELPEDAIAEARTRARRIPDGSSGLLGICGAALGVGIAVSVITGATAFAGE
ncbi:DUF5714 domain-containing protein, partial [Desulfosarcina cetonica]|uniref:DUF5714 domain-containing protein n=1 Tax=Desulfosarcina cetonica TaxID=90730 RepID=UPI001FEDD468